MANLLCARGHGCVMLCGLHLPVQLGVAFGGCSELGSRLCCLPPSLLRGLGLCSHVGLGSSQPSMQRIYMSSREIDHKPHCLHTCSFLVLLHCCRVCSGFPFHVPQLPHQRLPGHCGS